MDTAFKVSVRLMTYNHEKYIAQAIESVLMQKTNFPVELVIGDDNSTDNTLKIANNYSTTDNITIRILDRINNREYKRNRQIVGRLYNFTDILNNCTGKYVALLDGDDYWTDEYKLQKQVDFLEANPDFAICFHNAVLEYDDAPPTQGLFHPAHFTEFPTFEDLCGWNFIPTASCVFRNGIIPNLSEWFYTLSAADWPLHLLNAEHGKMKYIDAPMCVYRKHAGGIWSRTDRIIMLKKTITLKKECNKYYNNKYKKYFYKTVALHYAELMNTYIARKKRVNALLCGIKLLVIFKYNKMVITRKEIIKRNFILWIHL